MDNKKDKIYSKIKKWYTPWIMELSFVIPKNFRCKPIYHHAEDVKGKVEELCIIGIKQDAEICKEILERRIYEC